MAVAATPALALAGATGEAAGRARERFYRPELDLLRLLAFLMVWCDHAVLPLAPYLPGALSAGVEGVGACGVPVFFTLSAYLIAELFRREFVIAGRCDMRAFYLRRALRIWPLYLAVLGVYAMLGLRFHGFAIERGRLLASCLMAGNWYIALHPSIRTPLRALWSVSVEEQWYAGAALLFRRWRPARLALVCALLLLVAQGTLLLLVHTVPPPLLPVVAWVNSGVAFGDFAAGVLLAVGLGGRAPRRSAPMRVALLLFGFTCFALACACGIRNPQVPHPAVATCAGFLLTSVGAALLLAAFLGARVHACMRPLLVLGRLTYGLYLLHETGFFLADEAVQRLLGMHGLAAVLLSRPLALAVTVALALLSFHFWEKPFLQLKSRLSAQSERSLA